MIKLLHNSTKENIGIPKMQEKKNGALLNCAFVQNCIRFRKSSKEKKQRTFKKMKERRI